jgi:hypothetical protein
MRSLDCDYRHLGTFQHPTDKSYLRLSSSLSTAIDKAVKTSTAKRRRASGVKKLYDFKILLTQAMKRFEERKRVQGA